MNGKSIPKGETVTYYITVKNPASKKMDIRIEDKVSDHLEILSISDGGKEDDNNISWNLEGVSPGGSRVVTFEAKTKGDEDSHEVKNTADMITPGDSMRKSFTLPKKSTGRRTSSQQSCTLTK